jgi:hypothetical protein
MSSIIPHDTLIVARVVKKSPTLRGIRKLFTVFKLTQKKPTKAHAPNMFYHILLVTLMVIAKAI